MCHSNQQHNMRSLALAVLLCSLSLQLAAAQKLTGNLTSGITCTTGRLPELLSSRYRACCCCVRCHACHVVNRSWGLGAAERFTCVHKGRVFGYLAGCQQLQSTVITAVVLCLLDSCCLQALQSHLAREPLQAYII